MAPFFPPRVKPPFPLRSTQYEQKSLFPPLFSAGADLSLHHRLRCAFLNGVQGNRKNKTLTQGENKTKISGSVNPLLNGVPGEEKTKVMCEAKTKQTQHKDEAKAKGENKTKTFGKGQHALLNGIPGEGKENLDARGDSNRRTTKVTLSQGRNKIGTQCKSRINTLGKNKVNCKAQANLRRRAKTQAPLRPCEGREIKHARRDRANPQKATPARVPFHQNRKKDATSLS
jgi:hypothetical protein